MPFRIRKAPKRDLYWVIGPDGKHHSKDPLPKERAEAQMKALYSAMRREEEARVPTAREEKQIEKKMEGGVIPPLVRKYRRVLEFVTQRMEDGDVDPEVMFQVYNAVPRDQHGRAINVTQEHLDEIRAYLHPILSENHMSDLEGILNDANGNGGALSGGGPLPELSILQQIAKASYSTNPPQQIGPFKLRNYTPTLKFYVLPDPEDQRYTDTVVVGIRGTNTSDKQDLWADTQLALGKLEQTPRWTKDLADFKSFMSRIRNPNNVDIYGVGHSLGGAVLDMFLKKGLIQQGVSYNPAISLGDAQKDLNNRRIYQDGDPLLAIMGRSAKNVEIRPKKKKEKSVGRKIADVASYFLPYIGVVTKGMDTLDAHALDNFIGGTHLTNVLKKLGLKNEGHSLTELAKASKISRKTLQEVYNRGIGAYTTNPSSVRMKGTYKKGVNAPMSQKLSKEQWAMARVYSFIDGNPKHDTDLRGGMDLPRHREGIIESRTPSPFGSEYDDSDFDDSDHWTANIRLTKVPLLEIEEGDIDPITHDEFEDGDIVLYVPSGGRFKAVKVSTVKAGYPLPQDQNRLERDWFPVPYQHPPVSKRKVKIKPRGSGRLRGGKGMTKILNKMIKEVALDWKSEFGRKVKEAYDEAKRNLGMMMGTQSKKRFEVLAFYGRLILLAEEYAPDQVEHLKDKSDYYQNLVLRTRGDSVTRHSGSEGEVDHWEEAKEINRASGRMCGGDKSSTYLRQARAKAKAYGLDPKKLVFATDGKHKFSYEGVLFGREGYGDSLSYAKLEKEGKVPKGTTEMKKRVFHQSHEKIKGNWKANKVSPNNLALHILW